MTEQDSIQDDINDEEVIHLLTTVYKKYGFDFRGYSAAHIKRRIKNRLMLSGLSTISRLESQIKTSPALAAQFLKDLSINVTEMYRDPDFYKTLRAEVVPLLKTYSFLKIWHAGCSTGQEVYSMAILLMEEGLYDRSLIYATDFNQEVLDQAKEGIYVDEKIKEYTRNYQQAGGKLSLGEYYTSKYNRVIMDKALKKNIVWANHNLVTDGVFAEVNLIMCRNVLIYFNKDLQYRAHKLFHESLVYGGFLCLGAKETIRFSSVEAKYHEVDVKNRIYKKKY